MLYARGPIKEAAVLARKKFGHVLINKHNCYWQQETSPIHPAALFWEQQRKCLGRSEVTSRPETPAPRPRRVRSPAVRSSGRSSYTGQLNYMQRSAEMRGMTRRRLDCRNVSEHLLNRMNFDMSPHGSLCAARLKLTWSVIHPSPARALKYTPHVHASLLCLQPP
ncbi:hypothetical protein Bbelb_046610 [Branchiostoma belcheri]|nr:hypothetical protein Bbelb_046610 [Branchiostoma belcheri]